MITNQTSDMIGLRSLLISQKMRSEKTDAFGDLVKRTSFDQFFTGILVVINNKKKR